MSDPILKFFEYKHLPAHLQEVSKRIGDLAVEMDVNLQDGPEKTIGLRKLLEAKDCFVRARLLDHQAAQSRKSHGAAE